MPADRQAVIDRVLAHLKVTGTSGDGWAAVCPAHNDAKPSLTIHDRDGKILLHCHKGCSQGEVLAALGPELRELVLKRNESKRQIVGDVQLRGRTGQAPLPKCPIQAERLQFPASQRSGLCLSTLTCP